MKKVKGFPDTTPDYRPKLNPFIWRWHFRGRTHASLVVRLGSWLRDRGVYVAVEVNPLLRAGVYYRWPHRRFKPGPLAFKHFEPRPSCRAGRDGLD